ncbi:MAG TPA: hypothetical protein VEL31_19500 [Ktedonobacteraceae bacterium]|jgi:hypothetical protein|nr:hypothetical protein [Ktedonobacteraceae bacterium]
MKPVQLTLWGEPAQPLARRTPESRVQELAHHHMELVSYHGVRRIVCSAQPSDPEPDNWSAQFVGGAATAEECTICNPKTCEVQDEL